ncbi:hypothetical protein [Streptomyces sp. NPDC053431]|uniref:hypothetical protein n=1 Tax=Streptomyces sp. NPDC053431 TaxID=3365703 RepID=UPI0037D7AD21
MTDYLAAAMAMLGPARHRYADPAAWELLHAGRGVEIGEEIAGPNSSAFYPGPVRLERLPMTPEDRTDAWFGPDRGM